MKFSSLLANIIRSTWAIDIKEVESWLPQVHNWIQGRTSIDENSNKLPKYSAVIFDETQLIPEKIDTFEEAPEGSVAIVNIEGPMMLKGDWCTYGTEEIADFIDQATRSSNIIGTVLKIDTGGGTTDSVVPLVEAILKSQEAGKPVIALINAALSAGYWVASYADKIIASHDMAEFGSIGVFVKFPDLDKYYKEQHGLEYIEIYAPESSWKNLPFREALKGKYELMKSEILSPFAKKFIETVRDNRGKKLQSKTEGLLAGRVFFADDSIKNGLSDLKGNLQFAVEQVKKLAGKNQTSNISNSITMKRNQIPALMNVLGYESLEAVDGKYSISKTDIEKIQNFSIEKFGKAINFSGAVFEEDGSMTISPEGLFAINAHFVDGFLAVNEKAQENKTSEIEALKKKHEEEMNTVKDQLKKLADDPEGIKIPIPGSDTKDGKFTAPQSGLNVADDIHPWNKAALAIANGKKQEALFIVNTGITKAALKILQDELIVQGASTIDISQMNTILGDYFREGGEDIKDMMIASEEISSLFPWRSTGIKDEFIELSNYVEEFLQPRNTSWAEKGGFEFQAAIHKIKNWQVSHRYTAAQMWGFIESWLATKTSGTDPFQQSLVQWLTTKMMFHMWMVERPVNAIRGVYLTPADGVAGASINSMDGVLKKIQHLIADNRLLPFKIGAGTYNHLDENGNINQNHVYFKVHDMIKRIPQNLRDAYNWNVYISKEDEREIKKFETQIIANDPNYQKQEAAYNYANFTRKTVPHWPDGLIVITLPGNILQGYREKADDNRIYFDKEKRDTIVFMDGGYGILAGISGKKYDTYEELKASLGINQRIFTNGEFGPYTGIPMAADETSPSILIHNVLRTVANSGATVITTIDDANVGDIVYIIGGSDTNASVIEDDNANFIGLAADITFTEGVMAKFECTAAGKFTLVALYQQDQMGAIQFDADDTTPDVSEGYLFITSPENTGATDITDFDGAVVGKPFKVLGGGGANASTITKADKFAYISATWTADEGEEIILMKRPDGLFVEVTE